MDSSSTSLVDLLPVEPTEEEAGSQEALGTRYILYHIYTSSHNFVDLNVFYRIYA
jgi:hypothetical protein